MWDKAFEGRKEMHECIGMSKIWAHTGQEKKHVSKFKENSY